MCYENMIMIRCRKCNEPMPISYIDVEDHEKRICDDCRNEEFLKETKKLIKENPDIELALSKIDHNKICAYTGKECGHWREISEGDYECLLPDSNPDNPVCPFKGVKTSRS